MRHLRDHEDASRRIDVSSLFHNSDDDNDDGTAMTSLPTSDLNGKELLHDLKDVVCRDLYPLKSYSLS